MKAIIEKIIPDGGSSFSCQNFQMPVFDCPFHYHPEIEITHIISSHGQRIIGDNIESFEKDDFVMIGPDLPHIYYNREEDSTSSTWAKSCVLQFHLHCLGEDFFSLGEMKNIMELIERSIRGIKFYGKGRDDGITALQELHSSEGAKKIEKFLHLLQILSETEDYECLSDIGYKANLNKKQEGRINKVIQYLNENFTDEIKLDDAADVAGMTTQAFSSFFKKSCGKTFIQLLNEIRIDYACRLLRESDSTVAEICYASGFSNLSNFNRRFKDVKRQSPKSYRKQFIE